ncbi:dTDP-glucose 4,6-dehydratase [Dokdonia sp. Dokd-P16]|uniref:NAD-dependent epimerase/dehydratase family protein n=1 Tax=Dokdonia sp. Dokd-P16 TaxID=2173169 RepID=UPI000D548D47|nr:NAD-dependent epimerase/dehydratase family protein [Dokdonia sp. Dokd-P16]AWH72885.1 dTDP-glucose 4,6-dehydratase [Dokdonia sp. Dokd-P16]
MKILIIGSKGFIGSHCVDYFSSFAQVFECDVVTDYDNANYFLIDTVNADYKSCFDNHNYDLCINCSGAASVPDSVKQPLRDFNLNVLNVFKILDAIRQLNPSCKFINLSSAAVYGNPLSLPVVESQNLNPVSPYGYHKDMAENICREFHKLYDLNTCSVRVFSAYGPGLKKQLFWDLYKKSIDKDEVELFGTGNETRDFIYVTDLVHALKLIATGHSFNGESLNLGTGIETSIEDVVTTFYKELNYTGKIKFKGTNRIGDPINWVAQINKIADLGFQPQVSLSQGLHKYTEWLKE